MIGSSQPSAESGAVYALLAAIADPKKTKARLDELEQARGVLEEAQEKNRLTLEELKKTTEINVNTLAASDKALAERKADIDNQLGALNVARSDLTDKERDLAARRSQFSQSSAEASAKLEELSAELGKRELALDTREGDLKAREDLVRAAEGRVIAYQAEARAIKTDYERRTAALQEALKK